MAQGYKDGGKWLKMVKNEQKKALERHSMKEYTFLCSNSHFILQSPNLALFQITTSLESMICYRNSMQIYFKYSP
jgi:hypothetical protein